MNAPVWFWPFIAALFGVCIGSFLNVVIYRLPIAGKDLNLSKPVWSFCPNCERRLTGIDLVPLFSFLLLGRKCRSCKQPISWRYFNVELLTGLLFAALALRFQHNPADAIALMLFAAVLVPVFFIDLERFMIPLSLTLLTTLIPVVREVWGIAAREPGYELLWGWMPRTIIGALMGILVFGAVRVAGWLWKGVEAMGLGDVLLARGMGAMLALLVPVGYFPAWLFPAWVLLSCLSGIVVGVPMIAWRKHQAAQKESKAAEANPPPDEENFAREGTFGQQIYDIGWCVWLGDLWEYLHFTYLKPHEAAPTMEEDDWEPAPSAIPFGPFLVVGFLAAAFIGEWLTRAYLNYALPPTP